VPGRLRSRLSYANVTATLALVLALGGTSYAALRIDSRQVIDNSLRSQDLRDDTVRSRDVRDGAINGRDVRKNGLGGGAIKESVLGTVPRSVEASRLAGDAAQQFRLRCPAQTIARVGVCIEAVARPPNGFLGAEGACDIAGRDLPTMTQLDSFARVNGPLSSDGEWTSSVILEGPSSTPTVDRVEALLIRYSGTVGHARVNAPDPHPFRCVALPSN
jgi:hypothetical protein